MAKGNGAGRSRVGVQRKGRRPPAAVDYDGVGAGRITVGVSGAVFRPLKAAESVARDIVHDIIAQRLASGDALPAEAQMMAHYGVSRETLREGLRLLETQGLITIRRGPHGGPMVGGVDPANLGRTATLYFHMAGASYNDLFEAWVWAEMLVAERAARNPDAAERRRRMEPYLDVNPGDAPEELEEFVNKHTDFHGQLGALTGNRVLELTLRMYGLIQSHHAAQVDDPRHLSHVLPEDHCRIARAVIAGHPNKAREAMKEHIEAIIADHRKQLGNAARDYIEWL